MSDDTESPSAQAPDPSAGEGAQGLDPRAAEQGYVFDPESGFHWHPYAEHWYHPGRGIYLDPEGAPLAAEIAQAAVAESLARGDGLEDDEVPEGEGIETTTAEEIFEAEPLEEAEVLEAEVVEEAPAAPAPNAAGPAPVEDPSFSTPNAAVAAPVEAPSFSTPNAAVAAPVKAATLDGAEPQAAQTLEAKEWIPEVAADPAAWPPQDTSLNGEGKFGGLREEGLRVVGDELRVEERPPAVALEEGYADPKDIPTHFDSSRRVVVHLQNGAVQRGELHGADMLAPIITLHTPEGPNPIETRNVKAVFFMRSPDAGPPPEPTGRKVQLTLLDGRNLQGLAPNPLPSSGGFYLLPANTVANTAWIYVYPHAIRDLDLA